MKKHEYRRIRRRFGKRAAKAARCGEWPLRVGRGVMEIMKETFGDFPCIADGACVSPKEIITKYVYGDKTEMP